MAALFGVLAFLIALGGVIVAVLNALYLGMLSSAAAKRGMSGEPVTTYVRGQRTPAGILLAVAVLGLVVAAARGAVPDLVGLVLGAGTGVAAYRALGATRRRFRGA
ncbi:MAG: hypothetical protein ACT4O0_17425 [Pseudonocardia sp.]|jgi:hypothetical protein